MKLGWPFKLSVNVGFSIGHEEVGYKPQTPAERALELAVNLRPADTPSLLDSIQRAEEYLKFLEEHK